MHSLILPERFTCASDEALSFLAGEPMIARMARSCWCRLLIVLLLGLALSWPLLGSAPLVTSVHATAPTSDGCDDGSAGQICPTEMCPVIQAIVPIFNLDPPRTPVSRPIAADARGHGRTPDTETPPPRVIRLA